MRLLKVPAIDSADIAAARRRDLDIPRDHAAFLGVSARNSARDGIYLADNGQTVDWKAAVENAGGEMTAKAPTPGSVKMEIEDPFMVKLRTVTCSA